MKRIIALLFSIILCFCVFSSPLCALYETLDYNKKCSLTLTYSKNDIAFSDLEIKIFRVADADFEIQSPFDKARVDINNKKSQTEWNSTASTLSGYAQSENITPYKTALTDSVGKVIFEDMSVGLYLICGVVAQKDNKIYNFFDSMIYLPDNSSGEYSYDVSVKPKSNEIATPKKDYSVIKLWKDDGYGRPKSITVDILKNGEVDKTVVLSDINNWQYTFSTSDLESDWSVVEKSVPNGYTVSVTEKETSFVIVNTKITQNKPTASIPQTGDTSPIELFVLLFCISGLLLIILGIKIRRNENAAEK